MQPIFSNTCKYTLDNLKQVTKADLPMWYKAYCIIFAAVFGVIAIVASFMTHSPKSAIFLLFSITLLMIYYFMAALSIRLRKYADNWQNAKKCSKILRRMQKERGTLLLHC